MEFERGRTCNAMGPGFARPRRRVRLHDRCPCAPGRSAGSRRRCARALFLRACDPARGHARRGVGLYPSDPALSSAAKSRRSRISGCRGLAGRRRRARRTLASGLDSRRRVRLRQREMGARDRPCAVPHRQSSCHQRRVRGLRRRRRLSPAGNSGAPRAGPGARAHARNGRPTGSRRTAAPGPGAATARWSNSRPMRR